jgi:hypothetical protein
LPPVPELSAALPDGHQPPGFELDPPAVPSVAPLTVQHTVLPAGLPVTVTGSPTGDAPVEPVVPADAGSTPLPRADAPSPSTADAVEPTLEPAIDTVAEPVVEPAGVTVAGPKHDGDRTDRRANGRADEVPPVNPSEAIVWWRDKDPTLTLSQIAAKVGRSERTVRRTLDSAAASIVPAGPGQPAGDGTAPKRPTNGAAVDGLAGSATST